MKAMEIPFTRWNAAIPQRRSRRRFDGSPLSPDQLARMGEVCREFRPFPQARAEVVTQSPERILRGVVGSYGKVLGAPVLVAFVGDMDDPHVNEKVGYMGEGVILEATAVGLDTCWVGGFFRPRVAASVLGIAPSERVVAVTPLGHAVLSATSSERVMTGFGLTHRRRALSALADGLDEAEWPGWMKAALKAARLAPSAVNRQPWRFRLEPQRITISVDNDRLSFGISKRLDCGIAMLHIEVAALASGVNGTWELLEPPNVARFSVPGHSR